MKKITALLFCIVLLLGVALSASAATYESYTYNSRSEAVKSPAAYEPTNQLSGGSIGVGDFSTPADIYRAYDGKIYICDSGNNRIVILNGDYSLNRVIDEFKDGHFTGKFENPSGIFADKNTGILYIADTDNARVIGLDGELNMVKRFDRPEKSDLFAENVVFAPVKVAVDNGGRVFIVSRDVYEGLMQYDSNGNFLGFVGANEVSISPIDYFWKKISTKAQASKLQLTLPTEFSNLEIDEDGFIYTTTSIINTKNTSILVRRQNPSGDDVLHRSTTLTIAGDADYAETGDEYTTGASNFVDVTVNGNGMYSLLDSKRGRIFTYDFDGNLLYIFGGSKNNGNDLGCFYTPTAMVKNGDDFAVLDISNGMITVFKATEYGKLINSAVADNYSGKYTSAAEKWKEILKRNANFEQAYVGIGIAELRSGSYKAAMNNFKLGNDRSYYSKAFKLYRQQWLEKNFIWVAAAVVAALTALSLLLARAEKNRTTADRKIIKNRVRFAFHCAVSPFDGFYEMKRENKGLPLLSLVILIFTVMGLSFSKQLTGFIINTADLRSFNIFDEAVKVFGVFALYCVINWCVTALMDGEGKLVQIVNCTAACLIPLALSLIPLTLLSRVLTQDDAAFYYVLYGIVILYTVFLLVVGVMETHQYTLGKTVAVLIITLAGMVVAIFIAMLFVNLLNTMYDFVIKLYNEVMVR